MARSTDTKGHRKSRRRRGLLHQSFTSYLSFGYYSTWFVGIFLCLYALVLVCLFPMLHTPVSDHTGPLQGAHLPRPPSRKALSEAASGLRKQWQRLRKGSGVTDEGLLDQAVAQHEVHRAQKHAKRKEDRIRVQTGSTGTPGVMVLGMHRSGTSMLSGLMVQGAGYNVGGPLIGAAFDNAKGFFERVDVVLQNDEFMAAQDIWWAVGVRGFDSEKALEDKKSGKVSFKHGEKGLAFLNDPENIPWLQKDPRMCICLPVWLKLLDKKPAIVFTYRHPLEVAKSLNKREDNISIALGLRLWIIYNMRAVTHSANLCRVTSSNDKILKNPMQEVIRIVEELSEKCDVPRPPRQITQEDVDKFVDPNLQHNKKQPEMEQLSKRILEGHDGGCVVREYEGSGTDDVDEQEREQFLYKTSMKIFCDFQSGKAYEEGYEWPKLP